MDRKALTHWAAIIALATAFLGLGTAAITMYQSWKATEQKAADDRAAFERKLEEQRIALDLERQKAEAAARAAEKVTVCAAHNSSIQAVDDNFDKLYQVHGQLMNAMRSCGREKTGDAQGQCAALVCAAAWWWTEGESNCVDVASQVQAMKDRAEQEARNATIAGCAVKKSAAASFFD